MTARLKTVKDLGHTTESFVRMVARKRRMEPPRGDSPLKATVEVNHGNWIVHCPFCAGAELADPDDHRFFCLSCGNAQALGAWLRVRWPKNAAGIETALLKRPKEHTRNWRPGETVAQLNEETEEN